MVAMKVPRLVSRRHNNINLFLLVGICIYGVLHYYAIGVIDLGKDTEKHLDSQNVKDHGNDSGQIQTRILQKQRLRLERSASIDYFSCCGAGHRLIRLADAYYVAKKLEFTVRVFFGFCDHQEVFSYLFGARPLNEAQILSKINAGFETGNDMNIIPDMFIKVSNDVPGFRRIRRIGNSTSVNAKSCPPLDFRNRFDSDIELFTDLRDNRFRGRDKVDSFRLQHFVGHTVIGLHIRAGNGEEGNFAKKNRKIEDIDKWCQSMSSILISLSNDFDEQQPPLLFIATDTVSIISKLRTLLEGKIRILDLQQDRIDHGQGVLFGEAGNVNSNGDQCKNGWIDSFTDMMLLSHADVLVAGRPSSFTQSLPMTLVLSTPKSKRKVQKTFCEVNPDASSLMCFEDVEDWFCNGISSFSLHTIQEYDYGRILPVGGLDLDEYRKKIEIRPKSHGVCTPKPTSISWSCLPYEMPSEKYIMKITKETNKR